MPVRRDARPGRDSAAFTLIELVIVLVILAAATAMAIPALGPALESARTESAARRTAAFLDDARRRSVLERAVITVRCQPREARLELRGGGKVTGFTVPEQLEIASCSPEEVRYRPDGSATGLTLTLRDRRGRERRLAVGSFTGLTQVAQAP